jgi:hypothetical protein
MFLPATAVKISPALFMGLKLPAKIPIVFTIKFFLNSVVWFMMKPQRSDLIATTIKCMKIARRIKIQLAVSRVLTIFNGPIHNISNIIRTRLVKST